MVYPVLMTVLGVGFLFILFTFVIPQVVGIFSDFGRTLPLPTRILLAVTEAASAWWWAVLGGAAVLVLLFRKADASERFGPHLDRIRLRLPLFGPLALKVAAARLCYVLSSLLTSGVPLMRALETASRVMGNRVLESALGEAAESVRQGESLAASLRRIGFFPPLMARVVSVGEQSGDLPRMLGDLSGAFEEEAQSALGGLTAVLPVLLILFMGGVVLFVVVAVLLPIFDMNRMVRGG
jgi:type II secretory pathway component PulF